MGFIESMMAKAIRGQNKRYFLGNNDSYLKNISPDDNRFYDKI